MAARRSDPVTGENNWLDLTASFEPNERKLVSVRPDLVFKPVRMITPVSPLRFVLSGVLVPPGVEVRLDDHGVQCVHLGGLLVFEVWNESREPATLDVRVYGIAGHVGQAKRGNVGTPGPSGALS